jgi:hypothetical protein
MNVRIHHTLPFTAGVYYNGRMQMNTYSLKLWMLTNSMDANDHNISFERIKHFIYSEIESTIFINSEHREQCQLYANAGLNITTIPGEPVDQLIGIMLYCKLNAITETRMIIVETELSSHLGDGMVYIHSDDENIQGVEVPDWWLTPDLVHCDSALIDVDNVVPMHLTSAWRDFDLNWVETSDKKTKNDNTVVFADFGRDDTK